MCQDVCQGTTRWLQHTAPHCNTLQHTATRIPCCKGCRRVFYWLVSRAWHDWFVDVTCLIPFAWHVKGKHVSVFHDSSFYICVPWLILDVTACHAWSDNVTGLIPFVRRARFVTARMSVRFMPHFWCHNVTWVICQCDRTHSLRATRQGCNGKDVCVIHDSFHMSQNGLDIHISHVWHARDVTAKKSVWWSLCENSHHYSFLMTKRDMTWLTRGFYMTHFYTWHAGSERQRCLCVLWHFSHNKTWHDLTDSPLCHDAFPTCDTQGRNGKDTEGTGCRGKVLKMQVKTSQHSARLLYLLDEKGILLTFKKKSPIRLFFRGWHVFFEILLEILEIQLYCPHIQWV